MKIYLAHSSRYDYKNELYLPIKSSELNSKHIIIYLYDQTSTPGSTKDLIKNSDLVIAEVSYSSLGLGIELGWANAFNIPIICIHKKEMVGSSFINIISDSVFEYNSASEMVKILINLLH